MPFAKRNSIIVFTILAYLFTWLVWGSAAAQARGLLGWHIPGIFAFIGVATAAYISAALEGGWPAVRDLLARLVRWRFQPVWYGVAILLLPLLAGLAAAAGALFIPSHPARIGQDLALSAAVLYFFTNLPNMWLTEETAWRGFALPRLQRKYTALGASLIVGLVWGLWHLPLFLTPGSFQAAMPFGGFVVAALAISVLTTWIYNNTHESVLAAAIFHSVTDAAIAYTGVMSSGTGLFWLFVILLCLAAAGVTIAEGSAWLMRRQEITQAQSPTPAGAALNQNKGGGIS
jgi:uncharacterized protein